jgi:hypothetical protein
VHEQTRYLACIQKETFGEPGILVSLCLPAAVGSVAFLESLNTIHWRPLQSPYSSTAPIPDMLPYSTSCPSIPQIESLNWLKDHSLRAFALAQFFQSIEYKSNRLVL